MPVVISNTTIGFATKGLFFENGTSEIVPDVAIPTMPFKPDTAPAPGLNAFASTFSIDSFFTGLLGAQPISGWFNSTDTSTVDHALSGIKKFYGTRPVMIHYDMTKIEGVKISSKKPAMEAYFTVDLNFWVNKTDNTIEEAASITLQHTDFSFNLQIANMTASMVINTVNIDKILINSCAFGKLNPWTMKLKLNNGWRFAKHIVNKKLKDHSVTVPSKPTKYFEITNLQLSYYNSYLGLGFTPKFTGPTVEFNEWFS